MRLGDRVEESGYIYSGGDGADAEVCARREKTERKSGMPSGRQEQARGGERR